MKRVVSIIVALLLMICAVASVSAEISPTASTAKDNLIVDAIPVPDIGGDATPDINNPGKVEVNSGEHVTLTATPQNGYKFTHWEFAYGEFEIISGTITSTTIVIKPTGSSDVRAYAYFVKEGEDVTIPSSGTVPVPGDEPTSPVTGEVVSGSNNTAVIIACASVVTVALAVVIFMKKKQTV